MRLNILFFSVLIFSAFTAKAQQPDIQNPENEIITITKHTARIEKWFELIEQKAIILSYNPSLINLQQSRTVIHNQTTVGDLLRTILAGHNRNSKITLIKSPEPNKIIIDIQQKKTYNISGRIKENETGENLYGATVIFSDSDKKYFAVSNNEGIYSTSLAEGDYLVEVRFLGYKTIEKKIWLTSDLRMNFELESKSLDMEEVVIENRKGPAYSDTHSPSDLLSFNNADLFSQIRILPGVIWSLPSSDMQVNGGANDENLTLLDGIPIYHSKHLNSMLSAFNGDAVKSMEFHNSLFPTKFEGRISSVTDVRLKDGNKYKHSQTVSLDMPAVSVMLEGPILKNKISYLVSARRSWLDILDNLMSDENKLNYNFYDFNLKLSYDINTKTSLKIIAYNAINKYFMRALEPNDPILKSNNQLYACQLNWVVSNKLVNTTSVAYTSYSDRASEFTYDSENTDTQIKLYNDFDPTDQITQLPLSKESVTSSINEITLSSLFNYNANNTYRADWGINASFDQFNIDGFTENRQNMKQPIFKGSVFYDNRFKITDKLFAQAGVNVVAYIPANYDNYYSLQPRLSIRYTPDERNLLYAGFSTMAQFYHYIRMDIYSMPTDFRMPSIAGYKPCTSDQIDLGWKHFLPDGMIQSSVFYKNRHNILALKPEAFPWDEPWDESIMVGDGISYGIRFFMYNKWRNIALQLSYAYTRSLEQFELLKDRDYVASLSDIPHAFNIALTYNITKNSALSVAAVLKSGRIVGNADDMIIPPQDQFRTTRLPFNYRLDAGYTYSKNFNNGPKLLFRVGLYNIIGNHTTQEMINLYTVTINRNCMPYISVSVKF